MINIICVYNNEDLFNQMTESVNLRETSAEVKIVGIDNTRKNFKSAAEAYCYAVKKECDAETLIFCHQDIIWTSEAINKLNELCREDTGAIYGVAGACANEKGTNTIISSITEGGNKKYNSIESNQLLDVFSLDECAFAMNHAVLEKVTFDSNTCDDWHFYCVDLCMQCHQAGIKIKVVGVDIKHLSSGKKDYEYRKSERKIAKKWKRKYSKLLYTTGWTYTDPVRLILLRTYRKLKGTY